VYALFYKHYLLCIKSAQDDVSEIFWHWASGPTNSSYFR